MAVKPRYFNSQDWISFWTTTLIALAVYVWTVAPDVTLEDSGEFLTAACAWGVPHPSGYPAWAISANLFERLIPFGNAAWKGNLMSAFYGALAAGLLSLITSKTAARLLEVERLKTLVLPGVSREFLVVMAGMVGGLTFAFIDTMWSQAVIAEVYTLNGFFFTLLGLLVMRWFDDPRQLRWPCLIALVFGLAITNHQLLIISPPAFLFAMFCANRVLCRDACLLSAIACGIVAWQSGLSFLWLVVCALLYFYGRLTMPERTVWTERSLPLVVCQFAAIIALVREWSWLGLPACAGWLMLLLVTFRSHQSLHLLFCQVALAIALIRGWPVIAAIALGLSLVLIFSNRAFWSARNVLTLVFSIMLGCLVVSIFCKMDGNENTDVTNWLLRNPVKLGDLTMVWLFITAVFAAFWISLLAVEVGFHSGVSRAKLPVLVSFLLTIGSAIVAWKVGFRPLWIAPLGCFVIHVVQLYQARRSAAFLNVCTAVGSLVCAAVVVLICCALDFQDGDFNARFLKFVVAAAVVATLLAGSLILLLYEKLPDSAALRSVAPFILSVLMFAAGSSLYLYMPLASMTNPPMNWGYTRTLEGFRHHIIRGQYERHHVDRPGSNRYEKAEYLLDQYKQFFEDLRDNFSLPLLLLGLLPLAFTLFFHHEFVKTQKEYLAFSILCFICMGLLLVFLLNPKFDQQSVFINRVFYSLAHGVYAFWIGLGSILLLDGARRFRGRILFPSMILGLALILIGFAAGRLGLRWAWDWGPSILWLVISAAFFLCLARLLRQANGVRPAVALVCLLPVIPFTMNWADSEMHGHDYGWRYGHDMLKDLDRDAVVYGGTDPGRFVPTYMIFGDSLQPSRWKKDPAFDRHDLYIITQNALADQTYMRYIRDHYDIRRPVMDQWYHKLLGRDQLYPKDPLILPNDEEFNEIFRKVIEAGRNDPNSGVTFQQEGGSGGVRAQVSGIEGVFAINGAIAQWVFERNKDRHSFYVEESYPLRWMFPHLEPAGLIMKINKDPLPSLAPEKIDKDLRYWHELLRELLPAADTLANTGFRRAILQISCRVLGAESGEAFFLKLFNPFYRDDVARKSFSKLRSSLGGLYQFRGLPGPTEIALKEALDLYPGSAEARSRLTELYVAQQRFDEAQRICEEWVVLDRYNPQPHEALAHVKQCRHLIGQCAEMAELYEFNKQDPNFVFQYISALRELTRWPEMNRWPEVDRIVDEFLKLYPNEMRIWQRMVQFHFECGRLDRGEALMEAWMKMNPALARSDPSFIFQYAQVLAGRNKWPETDRLLNDLLERPTFDGALWQAVLEFYAQRNRVQDVESHLQRWTRREPDNALIWLNLGYVQAALNKPRDACLNFKKAFQLNSNLIGSVRADPRLSNLHDLPEFQKLFL